MKQGKEAWRKLLFRYKQQQQQQQQLYLPICLYRLHAVLQKLF